jgi:hypothetical protein
MSTTDHLSRARDYITIAESGDAKREAYAKAADEIIAWLDEDKTRSAREASRILGRENDYAGALVRWRTSDRPGTPFSRDTAEGKGRGAVEATRILRERPQDVVPEIAKAIQENPELAEQIARQAPDVASRMHEGAIKASPPIHKQDREPVAEETWWELGRLGKLTRAILERATHGFPEGYDTDAVVRALREDIHRLEAAISTIEGAVTVSDDDLARLLRED